MPKGRVAEGAWKWTREYPNAVTTDFSADINLVSGDDAPVSKDTCAAAFTVADCADDDVLEIYLHDGSAVEYTLKAAMIGESYPQSIAGIGTATDATVRVWIHWG